MKKNKEQNKVKNKYDKGQIFVKVTAGVLTVLMLTGTVATIVFALI